MSGHWLDPIWRRLASRIQPHILPRYSVMIRDSRLFATEENPAVSVTEGATNISLVSNYVMMAPKDPVHKAAVTVARAVDGPTSELVDAAYDLQTALAARKAALAAEDVDHRGAEPGAQERDQRADRG